MNFTESNMNNCVSPATWIMDYPTPGFYIENAAQVEAYKQYSVTPVKWRIQNQFISNDKTCYNIQPTIERKESKPFSLIDEEFDC